MPVRYDLIDYSNGVDPHPTFFLNADPDIGSQTNADPFESGSWSDFKVTKSLILT
jgi:hypothetical protein